MVAAGNGQLEAARREGWTHLAVADTSDLSHDEVRAFALADNRTAELSTWDYAALHAEMQSLTAAGMQLVDIGWTPIEVKDIAADLLKSKDLRDTDRIPPTPPTPTTMLGDVWVLGEHRLVCGSSSDPAAWAALMGTEKAQLVWTDPPYGVAIVGGSRAYSEERRLAGGGKVIENDDLDPAALRKFLATTLKLAADACEPGAVWYVAAPSGDLFLEFAHVLGREGMGIWRHTLAWVKDRFVMGRADYHYRHESILYGWVPGAGHYFVDERTHDTVLEVPRPAANPDHPTMKPVELVARCVRNSSRPGDIVVDGFGGSGTTLLAAEQENRRARLIELSPAYCDVIVRRWEQATGSKGTRICA